ncbi:MAG TPA: ATP-binding protein [Longimicrobiales bacterium]|nr:ATP-binding protein [Longimicrobiales bacterium]
MSDASSEDVPRSSEGSTSDLLLRSLFDHSFQFMGVLRPDGTVLDANRAALEFGRLRRSEVIGQPFWSTGWFAARPVAQAQVRDAITRAAAGEFVRCELDLLSAEGIDTTIDFSLQPVRNSAGEVVLLLPEGRDISELKWAERALRVSEARAAGIVSIASDAIISMDESFLITDFNQGAEHTFGYSSRDVLGKPLSMLLPDRYRAAHEQHVRHFTGARIAARKMGERQAIMGLRRDGTEFPAEASISKLHVAGQWIFTVVLRDITERKRFEEAQQFLAEAGALLASSLDYETTLGSIARLAVPMLADWCIIYIGEREGSLRRLEIVHADPARQRRLEELGRFPLDPRRPHPVFTVFETGTTEFVPEVTAAFLDAISASPENAALYRELGLSAVLMVPLRARGRIRGALGFFSANPSRRYEAHDIKLAEDLALLAALAVDNATLYREAQSAVQARDDMLSVVSHDLGNPLSAIRIGTSLLLRGIPPEEREHGGWYHLDSIRQSAEQMERLIRDLLEVKRLEAGKVSLERGAVAIEPLLSEAAGTFREIAAQRELRIECELPEPLPPVWADRQRVTQVLSNLLGNAVKFTPAGGVVRLRAERQRGEVVVHVSDTGCGIARDHLAHVFDRFWQARRQGTQGIGLGLTIARGIVEAHGGRIWVESEEGAGTTFSFSLPIQPVQTDQDAHPTD